MRQDFIFDLETIGANVFVCPVVDMAYSTFDWDRFLKDPYSFEELADTIQTVKLDIKDQMDNYNRYFMKADVAWWESLPKAARDKMKPSSEDLTVVEFCDTILSYIKDAGKIKYWWSRGNTFDPIILSRHMMSTGNVDALNRALKFYTVRDVRTHIDAKFDYRTKSGFIPVADKEYWQKSFFAHDSTHDVAADILRLQTIHRAENDLDQTDR